MSRAKAVAVGASAVELCAYSKNRKAITFSVGDATNASSVALRDGETAVTATTGFPLSAAGGLLHLEGEIASHRFTAIRLAAVDCTVGVIEEYPSGFEPPEGLPT